MLTGELQRTIPSAPRLPLPALLQQGAWEASAHGAGLALAVLLQVERGASVQDFVAWVEGRQVRGAWVYLLLQDFHLLSFPERQVVWVDAIIGVQGYHDVSLLLWI